MSIELRELFRLRGTPQEAGKGMPVPLAEGGVAWLVVRGRIDVHAMSIVHEGGGPDLHRAHLASITDGGVVFGFGCDEYLSTTLIMGSAPEATELLRLPIECIHDDPAGEGVAAAIERWSGAVSAICASDRRGEAARAVRPGERVVLRDGEWVQPSAGVAWILVRRGAVRFMGMDGAGVVGPGAMLPAGEHVRLLASGETQVDVLTLGEAGDTPRVLASLVLLHRCLAGYVERRLNLERAADRDRLLAKSRQTRAGVSEAMRDLRSSIEGDSGRLGAASGEDELREGAAVVLMSLGVNVDGDPGPSWASSGVAALDRVAAAERFIYRRVALYPGWSRDDAGPLLGFDAATGSPTPLIRAGGVYRAVDLRGGGFTAIGPEQEAMIAPGALCIIPELPPGRLRLRSVLSRAWKAGSRDRTPLFLIPAAAGTIAGLLPLIALLGFRSGQSVEGQSWTLALLAAAAVGVSLLLLRAASGLRAARAVVRVVHPLAAGLWVRAVRGAAEAGSWRGSWSDLAGRQHAVGGRWTALLLLLPSASFVLAMGLASVAVLLVLDLRAASIALAGITPIALLCAGLALHAEDRAGLARARARLAAQVMEIVRGVARIRSQAAEERAFSRWARRSGEVGRASKSVFSREMWAKVSSWGALPLGLGVGVWAIAQSPRLSELPAEAGVFLIALAMVLLTFEPVGRAAAAALRAGRSVRRMASVGGDTPDSGEGMDPGVLRGRVECSNVSFRYAEDSPPVLDRLSLSVEPGAFLAIAGPSGSGKSTLVRLILGTLTPRSGAVSFDGMDALGLDRPSLRAQVGAVMQDDELLPGDLFTNIVGLGIRAGVREAMEAARAAGIADEIRRMPMGLRTIVDERGSTLSHGQRQRVLLARALLRRPRLLILDEPTNALDPISEQAVVESLLALPITRIVVTHSEGVLRHADRIIVLSEGRVYESGTFAELRRGGTLFSALLTSAKG